MTLLISDARRRAQLRLIALTFLMLFLELALIRWLGANVLYLAFFANVVLLGSFLGIGLGFLWASRHAHQLFQYLPIALLAIVMFVRYVPVSVQAVGGGAIFFGAELKATGPPRELVLPVVFVAVATLFMCIGDAVGREFSKWKNLDAYGLDIVGSLIGIVFFTIASFLGAPPVVWAVIVGIIVVAAMVPDRKKLLITALPMAAVVGLLFIESTNSHYLWTPYYRVTVAGNSTDGVGVFVNGVPHWFQTRQTDWPIYNTAYERRNTTDVGDVLVIGAGSGNDVAVALAHGARHVDAVEIDPELLKLAKANHPNRPYNDPRVTTHVDDGRAYLERSDKKWDVILLALPDSITLVQGQSAVRLESYLFTREAADAYHDHLKPGGVFAMYNLYRERWLVDRYAGTLNQAFTHPPCVSTLDGKSLAVLTVGVAASDVTCPADQTWVPSGAVPRPASDDHPFPYIRQRMIPAFYVISIGIILLIAFSAVRAVGGPFRAMAPHLDLFLMGAAFLLLETKNVVQFALLFGTTWLVNAFVFFGVLASILLAITLSRRKQFHRTWPLGVILGLSLVVSYFVPASALLDLSLVPRVFCAVFLAFVPIFVANVLFAQKFGHREDGSLAFAANLLGAMVGGTLEYLALLVGFRNLLIVVALLYAGAFAVAGGHLSRRSGAIP